MGAMLKSRLALVLVLALVAPGLGRAADIDPLLPADTQSYLSINVKAILDAPLFKSQLLGPLKDLLGDTPEAKDILGDLGFDPLKDLDRVLFAMPGGPDTDRGLMVAMAGSTRPNSGKRPTMPPRTTTRFSRSTR